MSLDGRWWGERLRVLERGIEVAPARAEEIEPLRRAVLRDGNPELDATTPEDGLPTTLHLAGADLAVGRPIGCLTLIEAPFAGDPLQIGLRLALMAVDPQYQRHGVGSVLLRTAQRAAASVGTGIWANARDSALGFYARGGFATSGSGFIGPMNLPHHRIYWRPPVDPDQPVTDETSRLRL
ncbi:acetyltransferase (GNAT) family protein [Jatrophihabitans sp. GAS493]|nr:acetyltransferase (GNAT) family protein [Jatrophihabitans sp. GAS493]